MKKILYLLMIAVAGNARAQHTEVAGYKGGQIQVTPLLKTTTTSADQPIEYPQISDPEISILLIEIPPGGETGWHKHPYPICAYALTGQLSVEFEGGKTHDLSAGQAMVECEGLFHNGKNVGKEPAKLIVSVFGEQGKPFTVHKE
ncbi:MAG TPA: cupin domain-containing protein [Terrimicrobiaceae bacterium]